MAEDSGGGGAGARRKKRKGSSSDFNSKHPRDRDGKFAKKGSGSTASGRKRIVNKLGKDVTDLLSGPAGSPSTNITRNLKSIGERQRERKAAVRRSAAEKKRAATKAVRDRERAAKAAAREKAATARKAAVAKARAARAAKRKRVAAARVAKKKAAGVRAKKKANAKKLPAAPTRRTVIRPRRSPRRGIRR